MSERTCLIVSPDVDFTQEQQRRLNQLYDRGIVPVAAEELHLECSSAEIRDDRIPEFVRQLGEARVVIVNLDGSEPGVLYVAGVCHGLAIPAVMIAESYRDVPLLLRPYPLVTYHQEMTAENLDRFRRDLADALRGALDALTEPANPIQDYLPYDRKPIPRRLYLDQQEKLDKLNDKVRRLGQQEQHEAEAARQARALGLEPSPQAGSKTSSIAFRKVS